MLFAAAALITAAGLGERYGRVVKRADSRERFVPDCRDSPECEVWAAFRRAHPYPWQGVVAKRLRDDTAALIVTEPASALPPAQLGALAKAAFGKDLLSSARRQWLIAPDGWLEDLVLTVRVASPDGPLLDDRLFRDRVALLHTALFGTAFGAHVVGDDGVSAPGLPPPNVSISPRELTSWLRDESLLWLPLHSFHGEPQTWTALKERETTGAFVSNDRSLILLTFPADLLNAGRRDPAELEVLRKPFRELAVASDTVLGGTRTKNGQIAIVGRRRTSSFEALPTLRFETFLLLATQNQNVLRQAFQPEATGAGKDASDTKRLVAMLAPPLVNTEFGVLLQTADQILKSWSEAGQLEFQYFSYPKPETFPFKEEPLSRLVALHTRDRGVLATWTANSAAVVVQDPEWTTLTATRTAALPVAYRVAGAAPGNDPAIEQYRVTADRYFAQLGDPILSRVAQYTTLHQLLRTFGSDAKEQPPVLPAQSVHTATSILARSKSREALLAGGHELGTNVVHLQPGAQALELHTKADGGVEVRYPNAMAAGVESNADAIAEAIAFVPRPVAGTITALIERPVATRSRARALSLPEQTSAEPSPFGHRIVTGNDTLLNRLATLLQSDDCCVGITPVDRGSTYVATKGIAFKLQDTASLLEAVQDFRKPVLAVEIPRYQLHALAADNIAIMANAIGGSAATAVNGRVNAIVQTDLTGRVSFLQLPPEIPTSVTEASLRLLAAKEAARAWQNPSAKINKVPLELLLGREHWDEARDGIASTLFLPQLSVAVVAGFSEGNRAPLDESHQKTAALAATSGATRAQYLMTIDRFLRQSTKPPVRILLVVVDETNNTITITPEREEER